MILGLDPSLTGTGYVVLDGDKLLEKGVIRTGSASEKYVVQRYIQIQKVIEELLDKWKIRDIASEGVIFHAFTSEAMYAVYVVLQMLFYRRQARVVYLMTTQWRSLVKNEFNDRPILTKKDSREVAAEAAKEKLSSDEAEAYFIGRYGQMFWNLVDGKVSKDKMNPAVLNMFDRSHEMKRGPLKGIVKKEGIVYNKNKMWFDFVEG